MSEPATTTTAWTHDSTCPLPNDLIAQQHQVDLQMGDKFLVSLLFFILSPAAKLTYTVNNFFSKSFHPPQAPIPNSSQRVGQIVAVIFAPSIERIGLTPFNGGPVVPFPLCVLFRCKQRREKEVEDGFNFVSYS